jgi:pimeloyl-ACP methyl ester carboxylesterase/predicted small lipoprotein YifL
MRRTILAIASALSVAVSLAGCGGATPLAGPTAAPTTTSSPRPPCGDAAMAGTAVSFTNSVGGQLDGYLLGTGATGIVLANEIQKDACDWRPYAKQLAGRGYRVLAFDFNSDLRSGYVQGSTDNDDVASAAGLLRQRGAQKVVLLGASRGGTAVLVAATKIQPSVAGVISLSGPASISGMNASLAVPQLTVPVLYIVASLDRSFAADAQTLYNASPKALAKLVVLEGVGHGVQFPLGEAASSVRAMMEVDAFLAANAPAA